MSTGDYSELKNLKAGGPNKLPERFSYGKAAPDSFLIPSPADKPVEPELSGLDPIEQDITKGFTALHAKDYETAKHFFNDAITAMNKAVEPLGVYTRDNDPRPRMVDLSLVRGEMGDAHYGRAIAYDEMRALLRKSDPQKANDYLGMARDDYAYALKFMDEGQPNHTYSSQRLLRLTLVQLTAQADAAYKKGDHKEAEAAYGRIIDAVAGTPAHRQLQDHTDIMGRAHLYRGEERVALGQLDGARADFEKALEYLPENKRAEITKHLDAINQQSAQAKVFKSATPDL